MIDPALHWHSEEHRKDLLREAAEARLARRLRGQPQPSLGQPSRTARLTLRALLAAGWPAQDGREGDRP